MVAFFNLTKTWSTTWAWSWPKEASFLDFTVNAFQPDASAPVTPTPRTGPYVSISKVIFAYFPNFVDRILPLILRATATPGYMPLMMVQSPGFWRKGLYAHRCGLSTRIHPCQHRISLPTDSLVWEPLEDGTMVQLGQPWETTATSGSSTISGGFWQELWNPMFNTKSVCLVEIGTCSATLSPMVLHMALGANTGHSTRTIRTSSTWLPFKKSSTSKALPRWKTNHFDTTMLLFHLIQYEWLAPSC